MQGSLLKGTISRGLELLHLVLFRVSSHTQLVSTMQEWITWPAGHFLENEALGETAQFHRRQEHPSERDRKQQQRTPLPFQGDHEGPLYPPLTWTILWDGTYSNLYGHYIPDTIRRWGYIFWDASRLERSGATEVLARQWQSDWQGDDPRDNLY